MFTPEAVVARTGTCDVERTEADRRGQRAGARCERPRRPRPVVRAREVRPRHGGGRRPGPAGRPVAVRACTRAQGLSLRVRGRRTSRGGPVSFAPSAVRWVPMTRATSRGEGTPTVGAWEAPTRRLLRASPGPSDGERLRDFLEASRGPSVRMVELGSFSSGPRITRPAPVPAPAPVPPGRVPRTVRPGSGACRGDRPGTVEHAAP